MSMTKLERNRLYQIIAESDLDPAECSLTVTDDKALITHDSGSTFEYERAPSSHGWIYRITRTVIDGNSFDTTFQADPKALKVYLHSWANEVKKTVEAPDLWAEMRRSRELITSIQRTDTSNLPFTQDEQRQIAARLQEIKEQLRQQFELTAEQIAQVDEKLDEAADASTRMGRKDWLLLFSGTIFNLIVTDTVTPGVAGHIFTTVVQGIAHLFGAGGPPQILA